VQDEDKLINNVDAGIQTVLAMTSRATEGKRKGPNASTEFREGGKMSDVSAVIEPYLWQLQM